MPNFEHYSAGEGKDETKRLYGNDISANEFHAQPFKAAGEITENTDFYGDEGLSAEDKIYKNLDGEIEGEEESLREIDNVGQSCDAYLNNKGPLPKGLTPDDARELAFIYQKSLGAENQVEKNRIEIEFHKRYTEIADLKPGQIAHATPDPKEKVQLNRIANETNIPSKKKILEKNAAA